MRSREIVLSAKNQCPMTGRILVAHYGVRLPPPIRETYVPNSDDRRIDFTGAIDYFGFRYILWPLAKLKSLRYTNSKLNSPVKIDIWTSGKRYHHPSIPIPPDFTYNTVVLFGKSLTAKTIPSMHILK